MLASQTYDVPPAVMLGIMKAEGGTVGQEVRNSNGTYDLGPMQINTVWVPELAQSWGVTESTAKRWIRDDACTNMGVSAWILKNHLIETGNIKQAIAHYHSRTPHYGKKYQKRVFDIMEDNGLIKINGR
jgi:soluble lytic murein transglycosylase-like protein